MFQERGFVGFIMAMIGLAFLITGFVSGYGIAAMVGLCFLGVCLIIAGVRFGLSTP